MSISSKIRDLYCITSCVPKIMTHFIYRALARRIYRKHIFLLSGKYNKPLSPIKSQKLSRSANWSYNRVYITQGIFYLCWQRNCNFHPLAHFSGLKINPSPRSHFLDHQAEIEKLPEEYYSVSPDLFCTISPLLTQFFL